MAVCPNIDRGMNAEAWDSLLQSMTFGECVPFLGAGASSGHLPKGIEIANRWADQYEFPLKQRDLMAVSQYLAVTRNINYARNLISKEIQQALPIDKCIDFSTEDNIHGLLAQLPIGLYLTTNYDDLIERALLWAKDTNRRNASFVVEHCRWHSGLRKSPPPQLNSICHENPLVYHFHGIATDPKTIVLTEDDYEEFLVELSADAAIIPNEITEAIGVNQLMFVGYSLQDWNFRVLFRTAIKNVSRLMRVGGITVQISPSEADDPIAAADYLEQKYEKLNLKIYWGTAANFSSQLHRRARELGLIR